MQSSREAEQEEMSLETAIRLGRMTWATSPADEIAQLRAALERCRTDLNCFAVARGSRLELKRRLHAINGTVVAALRAGTVTP